MKNGDNALQGQTRVIGSGGIFTAHPPLKVRAIFRGEKGKERQKNFFAALDPLLGEVPLVTDFFYVRHNGSALMVYPIEVDQFMRLHAFVRNEKVDATLVFDDESLRALINRRLTSLLLPPKNQILMAVGFSPSWDEIGLPSDSPIRNAILWLESFHKEELFSKIVGAQVGEEGSVILPEMPPTAQEPVNQGAGLRGRALSVDSGHRTSRQSRECCIL